MLATVNGKQFRLSFIIPNKDRISSYGFCCEDIKVCYKADPSVVIERDTVFHYELYDDVFEECYHGVAHVGSREYVAGLLSKRELMVCEKWTAIIRKGKADGYKSVRVLTVYPHLDRRTVDCFEQELRKRNVAAMPIYAEYLLRNGAEEYADEIIGCYKTLMEATT